MSYGQSMRSWEARDDERREMDWLNDLEQAIKEDNQPRVIDLLETGVINDFEFPDFPEDYWVKEQLEVIKESSFQE